MRNSDSEEREYEDDIDDDVMDDAMPFDEDSNIDDELEAAGMTEEWCPECHDRKPHKILQDGSHMIVCAECNCEHRREKDVPNAKPVPHGILTNEEKKDAHQRKAAWIRLTTAISDSDVIKYSIHADLKEGDIINHSKFGRGVVIEKMEPNKVEVLFEDDLKRLVCCK